MPISQIPPAYRRISDGAYPIPAWHSPDLSEHVEVLMDDPPNVPAGSIAELEEQPDEHNILRYTVRPMTDEEIEMRDPIPQSVSALQGRLAIKASGLIGAFIAWKAGLDPVVDFETIAFFEAADTWDYGNSILDRGLSDLGVLDQKPMLFKLAATL